MHNQLMVPKCQTGQEKSKWRGLGRAVTGGLNSISKAILEIRSKPVPRVGRSVKLTTSHFQVCLL